MGFAMVLAACSPAPMPPPAAGNAPAQDAMAPSDVAGSSVGTSAAPTPPAVMPPPDMGAPAEPMSSEPGTKVVDGWVGTWTGPEGTSLKIARQEVGYEVTVTNLDGPRQFHGIAAGDALQFERDGTTETVHAGDGAATGMKWLAGRKDCLVVKAGEGYCRDRPAVTNR